MNVYMFLYCAGYQVLTLQTEASQESLIVIEYNLILLQISCEAVLLYKQNFRYQMGTRQEEHLYEL